MSNVRCHIPTVPVISSHKQLQAVGRLPFCYVCTKPFELVDATDRDHVPPESCFAKADRNVPLVLRTHVACNHTHNANDELVGQLVSLKHGRAPTKRGKRLNVEVIGSPQSGDFLAKFDNLNFGKVIHRWIRGFHAALYQEPLADSREFYVSSPLPIAEISNGAVNSVLNRTGIRGGRLA
jgi:hypothetical protein